MTQQPTIRQKLAVVEYLDKCEPDAWTAFTRWMRDQLLADDQKTLATILFREAARRNERTNQFKSDNHKESLESTFQTVLADVGLKLAVA